MTTNNYVYGGDRRYWFYSSIRTIILFTFILALALLLRYNYKTIWSLVISTLIVAFYAYGIISTFQAYFHAKMIFNSEILVFRGYLVPTIVLNAYTTKNTCIPIKQIDSIAKIIKRRYKSHDEDISRSLALLIRYRLLHSFLDFIEFTKCTNEVIMTKAGDTAPLKEVNYFYRIKSDGDLEVVSIEYI